MFRFKECILINTVLVRFRVMYENVTSIPRTCFKSSWRLARWVVYSPSKALVLLSRQ